MNEVEGVLSPDHDLLTAVGPVELKSALSLPSLKDCTLSRLKAVLRLELGGCWWSEKAATRTTVQSVDFTHTQVEELRTTCSSWHYPCLQNLLLAPSYA
jgi:hypothetical protein